MVSASQSQFQFHRMSVGSEFRGLQNEAKSFLRTGSEPFLCASNRREQAEFLKLI